MARGLLLSVGLAALGSLTLPDDAHAAAQRAYVQKRYFQVTSGSSVSVSLRRPDTLGNLLVAFVVWDNGDPVSLADTTGSTWASAVGPTSAGGTHAQIFYAGGIAAGVNTVTATFATPITVRGALYVVEYSGIDRTSPLAGAVAASGTSPAMDSGPLAVAAARSLLIVGGASNQAVKRQTRGYRARARKYGNLVAEQVAPAAGSYDVAATQTGTEWVMQLVAFRPSSTDTTPPSVPANLGASNVTSNAATISWTPSTDDTGVAGYRVFRDGSQIGTTSQPHYTDPNLSPSTTYAYAVAAYDAAGNVSATSAPLSVTTTAGPPAVVYPLKVGPTGRYLVGQNDLPFLITGDSPQALIVNLSEAEADGFFADRRAAGFNVVWINLLCATYTGGRADGSTYDGIIPFTTPGDLSTPNESYFARVDDMIGLAAQHGLTVLLDPAETGSWLAVLSANGVAKSRDYGRYLGTRYRSIDNIVWMSGNDFQSWPNPGDDAVVEAVARGIQDTDDRHIHTVELDYPVSGSLDDPGWAPIIQLNASYTYYPTYAQVLTDYNRSNAIPTFLVEANYEFEHNAADLGTPEILRRQAYWTMLSGAAGQMYGNGYTWPFASGWQSNLDTPGSQQMGYVKFLFESRQWYDLIPDQGHTLVTAGYGTYADSGSLEANDYVTAARTPDGALAMAYMPTVRTITVDMSRMGSPVQASWYDPSNGTFTAIAGSPLPNTGTRAFAPTGSNSAGDGDWVLVLDATSVPPDTQAPSVPTGLSVTATSSSEIDIAWAPSTDNVGVAGYQVYRDGTLVRTTSATAFADLGLAPLTSHTYTVAAYDYANNLSAPSAPLVATTAGPAPTFVQQGYATPQSPQSLVSATYPGAQTAGDANILAIGWNDTTATITSVTDGAGNVYHQAVATFRGNGMSQAIFYAVNIAAAPAGTNQVSVAFDQPAVFVDLRVTEYSDVHPTSPFDAGASATGTGTSASASLTTAGSSELLFVAGMTGAAFTVPGTGFTSRVVTAPDGDIVEDAVAASAGSHGATASLSSGTWLLQVAAFAGP
jgi:chitodextrinase